MAKGLMVIEELCNGCRLCEMACSFMHAKEYNPSRSLIKIIKVEDQGIGIPVHRCIPTECPHLSSSKAPRCAEVCPPGALLYGELDEIMEMRRDLVVRRAEHHVFKVVAPWKFPFHISSEESNKGG